MVHGGARCIRPVADACGAGGTGRLAQALQ